MRWAADTLSRLHVGIACHVTRENARDIQGQGHRGEFRGHGASLLDYHGTLSCPTWTTVFTMLVSLHATQGVRDDRSGALFVLRDHCPLRARDLPKLLHSLHVDWCLCGGGIFQGRVYLAHDEVDTTELQGCITCGHTGLRRKGGWDSKGVQDSSSCSVVESMSMRACVDRVSDSLVGAHMSHPRLFHCTPKVDALREL